MSGALKRAVAVAKSFDEKAPQLSCGALSAYGIELSTRYSKCSEMIEMLHFAQLAAEAGAAAFVKSLFYDSKASLCTFTWHGEIDAEAEATLRACADRSIMQYQWVNGDIGGRISSEPEEPEPE